MLDADFFLSKYFRQAINRVLDIVAFVEGGVKFILVNHGVGFLVPLEDKPENKTDKPERLRQAFPPIDARVLQFLDKSGVLAVKDLEKADIPESLDLTLQHQQIKKQQPGRVIMTREGRDIEEINIIVRIND